MPRSYVVKVPLEPGTDRWFDVCRCTSPEAAAAVILALLTSSVHGPYDYRVTVEGWDADQPA